MERKQRLDGAAVVILLGCCVLWGLNQVAAKAALAEIGPLWQAALRSGFDDHLTKPVNPADLLRLISQQNLAPRLRVNAP